MKTVLFKNKAYSYQLTMLLGVLSGTLAVIFSKWTVKELPYFSFNTMIVWMTACSLIALFSEKNLVAGLHTSIYMMFMFAVPTVKAGIKAVSDGEFWVFMRHGVLVWVVLALLLSQACMLYGFVMNYGRKRNIFGWILRFLPAVLIAEDEIHCIRTAAILHRRIYSSVFEGILLILYLAVIIITMIREKEKI